MVAYFLISWSRIFAHLTSSFQKCVRHPERSNPQKAVFVKRGGKLGFISNRALVLAGDVWPTGRSRITHWCLRARSGAWLFLSALKPMVRERRLVAVFIPKRRLSSSRQEAGASRHFFYCH